ncbi:MAG: hypothetical protein P4L74_04850 [Candidatus Doudnabacteria bacterium]|nr:hypothetical protein [Candidatus Doudnabacteria bacterium]
MELTKKDLEQVLDKRLANVATKVDLKNFATKNDLKDFVTKFDLQNQTKELKQFAEEQTDALARIISKTVAIPMEVQFRKLNGRIDLQQRVEKLETDMSEMKIALHLS